MSISLNTYSHLLKETSSSAMARLAMRMPMACEDANESDGQAVA